MDGPAQADDDIGPQFRQQADGFGSVDVFAIVRQLRHPLLVAGVHVGENAPLRPLDTILPIPSEPEEGDTGQFL